MDHLATAGRGLRVYRGKEELGFWETGTLQEGDVIVEIKPTLAHPNR